MRIMHGNPACAFHQAICYIISGIDYISMEKGKLFLYDRIQ